jgi:NADH pyrophosphatase NudC (nudix superfamily)
MPTWQERGRIIREAEALGFEPFEDETDKATWLRAQEFLDNYDPTPWCSYCGSKTRAGCDCGPIAENE